MGNNRINHHLRWHGAIRVCFSGALVKTWEWSDNKTKQSTKQHNVVCRQNKKINNECSHDKDDNSIQLLIFCKCTRLFNYFWITTEKIQRSSLNIYSLIIYFLLIQFREDLNHTAYNSLNKNEHISQMFH